MRKIELLAPAQNKQCAISAINYGADAVYMGANYFGARKNAGNSINDIKEVVEYAHKFYVKIYCTINTILDDKEIKEAAKLIQVLYETGVDGIIIQDTGLIQLAIEDKLPPIPLYASTQCDNRTLEKVNFLSEVGIQRVILARELSLEQIKNICQNTKTEIETFIHGALCVSYSGQCFLSYASGGRSANRGECAQPCRKKYSLIDKNGKTIAKDKYLLSLKDFNTSKHLKAQVESGVSSFKIEGRLKDENYIKNIVGFYNHIFNDLAERTSSGKIVFDFEPNSEKSFNRGFTDYFLNKRQRIANFETPKSIGEQIGKVTFVARDYFETDGNKSLHSQDGICFEESGCLINRVDGRKIYPNKMDGIKKGIIVFRNFDSEFSKKLDNSKTKRQIKVEFEVLNGKIKATDEDKNQVEIDLPSSEKPKNLSQNAQMFEKQIKKTGESDFFCEKLLFSEDDLPFMPVSQVNKLRRELLKKLMQERLKNYKQVVQQEFRHVKYPTETVDYSANIHNKYARKFYEACGCKILEGSIESGTSSADKPLMTTKHCLKYEFNMCGKDTDLFLLNERGQKFHLEFDCKNCCMKIFKS